MRTPLRPAPLRTAAVSLAALACACGGHRGVRVPMLRPAEVNLAAYQTLAVTQLAGDRGNEIASLIEEKLMETGRFQIVDRVHMNQVMTEQRLSASDLAQSGNAVKLGQIVTAGALISGSVEERYREIPKSNRWKDSKGVEHTDHWVEGEAIAHAALKLIDVTTGRLILARNFDAKKDSARGAGSQMAGILAGALLGGGDQQSHPAPDRNALLREAREQVVADFAKAVAPRKEMIEVAFAEDGKLPQLQAGIGWAQRGEWKKAQDTFNEAIRAAENDPRIDSKTLAKAYLNTGLAHVFAGDYEGGIKLLTKGYDLSADPALLDQIDFAKKLQGEARRLGEQTAAPAGG
jgi:curli biogenesis system outer membrane secretion channel CsgG